MVMGWIQGCLQGGYGMVKGSIQGVYRIVTGWLWSGEKVVKWVGYYVTLGRRKLS